LVSTPLTSSVFLPVSDNAGWFQYGLFYLPVGVMVVVGAVMIGVIITHLVKSWIHVADKIEKRSTVPYIKISVFGIAFLFVWSAIFTSRVLLPSSASITTSIEDWVGCHVSKYSLNVSSTECGDVPPNQANRHTLQLQYVAMSIHGIVLFGLFCADRDLYQGWRDLFVVLKGKLIYWKIHKIQKWQADTSEDVALDKMFTQ